MERIIVCVCVCVCVCVNSTFGRCCHCPCWKEDNHGEEEVIIGNVYEDNSESLLNNASSDGFGGVGSNDKENEVLNNNKDGEDETNTKEEILYYKIVDKNDNSVQSCFCKEWYEQSKDGVVQLVMCQKEDNDDVLEVIGNGNNWRIVDKNVNSLNYSNCDPSKNTWIIFSITLWDEAQQKEGETLTFYVDDISSFDTENTTGQQIAKPATTYGVFKEVGLCYSIKILSANTQNVKNVGCMFYGTKSKLEKDRSQKDSSGLIGLERLNMCGVSDLSYMFDSAIYKQSTLDSLAGWRFNAMEVWIESLFSVERYYYEKNHLNWETLNGWELNTNGKKITFFCGNKKFHGVFIWQREQEEKGRPRWYENIVYKKL